MELHPRWPSSMLANAMSIRNFWVGAVRYTNSLLRSAGSVPSEPRRTHRVSRLNDFQYAEYSVTPRSFRLLSRQLKRMSLWDANMRKRSITCYV